MSECQWCEGAFAPRSTGGKPQTFCRPACRRAFDAAGRKFVASEIAAGRLTVEALRNGAATTRAVLLAGVSPPPADRPGRKPECSENAAKLLNDFAQALLDLPVDAWPPLPDELIVRLLEWLDAGTE
jgi:hypothetical protein